MALSFDETKAAVRGILEERGVIAKLRVRTWLLFSVWALVLRRLRLRRPRPLHRALIYLFPRRTPTFTSAE